VRHSARCRLLFLAVLLVVALLAACSRPVRPTRGTRLQPMGASSTTDTAAAVKLTKHYLEALYRRDYREAYHHLSAASADAHPFTEFERQAEAGVTAYDLTRLTGRPDNAHRVTVVAQFADEPGSHEFELVRASGEWRILFRRGKPASPYP